MNFDYKKYSLENLENWMQDALSCSEATPQEIYDVIKSVVSENYHIYKNHTERCYELLALLNGNGHYFNIDPAGNCVGDLDGVYMKQSHIFCDKDDKSPECKNAWNDFWEENYYPEEHKVEDIMPPWGHSDMEALRYSEEELNAMCDKAASDQEKEKCREYNLREAEYYDKRAKLDAKQDKVVKWQLPVEIDGASGEYYIQFPDDLMEAANLKENEMVEWIDLKNGSFELRKVNVK